MPGCCKSTSLRMNVDIPTAGIQGQIAGVGINANFNFLQHPCITSLWEKQHFKQV